MTGQRFLEVIIARGGGKEESKVGAGIHARLRSTQRIVFGTQVGWGERGVGVVAVSLGSEVFMTDLEATKP